MAAIALPSDWTLNDQRIVSSVAPALQQKAVELDAAVRRRGLSRVRWNSGLRTAADQARLIEATQDALAQPNAQAALAAAGVTGIVASDPARPSRHQLGLALDGEPVPKSDATWRVYGEEAERLGLTWGGRWRRQLGDGTTVTDRPHIQLTEAGAGVAVLAVTLFVAIALGIAGAIRPRKS